jgi:hypothetical protein
LTKRLQATSPPTCSSSPFGAARSRTPSGIPDCPPATRTSRPSIVTTTRPRRSRDARSHRPYFSGAGNELRRARFQDPPAGAGVRACGRGWRS